jgi:hypothetical protein
MARLLEVTEGYTNYLSLLISYLNQDFSVHPSRLSPRLWATFPCLQNPFLENILFGVHCLSHRGNI